ncbi:MAG TPA: ABC transporter permease [Cellulomonas sp.]
MLPFARSAVRASRGSVLGSFVVLVLASALLTATGTWMVAGARLTGAAQAAGRGMLLSVTGSFAGTAVVIVVLVVASAVSQALRQRRQQFALLRAVGATPSQVRRMITGEVLLVLAAAVPVGVVAGTLVAPLLTGVMVSSGLVPAGYHLPLTPWPALGAVVLLLPAAVVAARLATRTVTRVSVTAAGRAAATEEPTLGRVRTVTAVAFAVAGLAVAGVPLVVGGLVGSAAAASSALLLLVAAALGGPVLVAGAARRGLALVGARTAVAPVLALRGARGFSRRLTGAILPLALLVALGAVQVGSNAIMADAARVALRDGIRADLVVQADDGLATSDLAALAQVAGVTAVGGSTALPAEVRVEEEDEDLPFLSALDWEPTTLRALVGSGLIDPDVRSGSLDDLVGDRTIAVSSEAVLGTFASVGDEAEVRLAGGEVVTATIVAVYDRGLAFGDYLVAEDFAAAHHGSDTVDAALLAVDPGALGGVRAELGERGLRVLGVAAYAQSAVTAGAAEQRLSLVALLALLVFVALAAANTLVMLTSARGPELRLLQRTGATRGQIAAVVAVESAFVALTAIVIGTLCVLPALLGVGYASLGTLTLGVDAATYGALVVTVVVIAVGGLLAPAVHVVRGGAPRPHRRLSPGPGGRPRLRATCVPGGTATRWGGRVRARPRRRRPRR